MELHKPAMRQGSSWGAVGLGRLLALLALAWAVVLGHDAPPGIELCLLLFVASVLLLSSADRSGRGGIALVMAFVITTTMAPANFSEAPAPFGAAAAALLLGAGLWMRRSTTKSRSKMGSRRNVVIGLVSIAAGVNFLVTSINPGQLNLSSYFLYSVVLPILAITLGSNFRTSDLHSFCRGMFVFAFIQIIFSVCDVFFHVDYPIWGYWLEGGNRSSNSLFLDQFHRAQGLSSHSIVYSLCVLLALSFVLADGVRWSIPTRILAGACLICGLVLSGTRSAVLAALLIVTVYGLLELRRMSGKFIFVFFVFLATAYFLHAKSASSFLKEVSSDLLGSGSFNHRLDGLKAVGDVAQDRGLLAFLFGEGGASVPALFASGYLQQDGLAVVDNQLVTSFLVGGLLGFLALISCIVAGLAPRGLIGMAMLAVGVMIFSFDLLTWPAGVVLFYGLAGCGLGLRGRARSSSAESRRSRARSVNRGRLGDTERITSNAVGA